MPLINAYDTLLFIQILIMYLELIQAVATIHVSTIYFYAINSMSFEVSLKNLS